MPKRVRAARSPPLGAYRAKRNFSVTTEPGGARGRGHPRQPIFVVQKHAARRLHWDFRLEHGGVLWSWAVPKGPSMDPADRRLAVHVEDHPRDYADFEGRIPAGQYGAGTVETWDRGTWQPEGDPATGMRQGEIKFTLAGQRLSGGFVLVRLKPRGRGENWLLIKEHDGRERPGADAAALEDVPAAKQKPRGAAASPAPGARRGALPAKQAPQLATPVEEAPDSADWLSEVKFDGYRVLAWKDSNAVRLVTRNAQDWTARLPSLAHAVAALKPKTALLDGELVALQPNGISGFAELQQALSARADKRLCYYAFDLLHLDGWDLRPCALQDRKSVLKGLAEWDGVLRYSDDAGGEAARVWRQACTMGLEGIVCKRRDASYRAGRGRTWLKVKCQGREEFVVLGWTPPAGRRAGLGSLHLGFYDRHGRLHYVGGVGTGFSERELTDLSRRLGRLAADAPPELLYVGEPPERSIQWVKPELVIEVQYAAWSGSGRLRHAVFLGRRDDKPASDVVRAIPDEAAKRMSMSMSKPMQTTRRSAIAQARAPGRRGAPLSHADRELWPGITKQALADYWQDVATIALPGIAHRPLAVLRCPDGIDGQRFFQKHGHKGLSAAIREGTAGGQPYLTLDDTDGLRAMAQVAAIELHTWGASEDDPLHPDRIVFDLDPGEGVAFAAVVQAAKDVRARLERLDLDSFCRTTGGKGLHVVAPLTPEVDWDTVREFCRGFAERMAEEERDRFVARVPKAERRGRILVDWLRNGLGATAVASFSPRARPGATVATPLAWREVTAKLDPSAFTLESVQVRLRRQKRDPWEGFATARQKLPPVEKPNRRGGKG